MNSDLAPQHQTSDRDKLDFTHRWIPGVSGSPTLLLLHGTGGSENDLIPLGRSIAPGASLLGVRGKVLENGMPRFFRRLAEGVFDQVDLERRTDELAQFIRVASEHYGFGLASVVALGYSNGANIAASAILRHPDVLRRTILLRAMVPFRPPVLPDLSATSVMISAGLRDPIMPAVQTEALATMLRSADAEVDLRWQEAGHELTEADRRAAAAWLEPAVDGDTGRRVDG